MTLAVLAPGPPFILRPGSGCLAAGSNGPVDTDHAAEQAVAYVGPVAQELW